MDEHTTWHRRAACRGLDFELFFGRDGERQPERERREKRAKRVCRSCAVRPACLDYAVAERASGVWGGLNDDERKSERRRRLRRRAS